MLAPLDAARGFKYLIIDNQYFGRIGALHNSLKRAPGESNVRLIGASAIKQNSSTKEGKANQYLISNN